VLPGISLRPGDRVRILPNHACVVTNLTDELLLVDGLDIIDRIPVAARGRST
jgi:D-serine deaminase-like pyridoxal phosphate-dependent protein